MPTVRLVADKGVNPVIGTGLASADRRDSRTGALLRSASLWAPEFALGAVLMMHLAKLASRYFDYAEIIEFHHHLKADASGRLLHRPGDGRGAASPSLFPARKHSPAAGGGGG
jgi:dihydrodipicolinate reductase